MSQHEPGDVSSVHNEPVRPGQVFSIEPGIYLPGDIGVRIEDLVIVTDDGCEVLNSYPKELTVLAMERAERCERVVTFSATRHDADVWASRVESLYGLVQFTAHTPTWTGHVILAMGAVAAVARTIRLAVCR